MFCFIKNQRTFQKHYCNLKYKCKKRMRISQSEFSSINKRCFPGILGSLESNTVLLLEVQIKVLKVESQSDLL